MRFVVAAAALAFSLVLICSQVHAAEAMRLPSSPALSPDGATLAFAWRGDLWLVPSGGGVTRQWTAHARNDAHPVFSPDGRQIAFSSDRSGTRQVYVANVSGGVPRQVTFHSEGSLIEQWLPDGQSLIVSGPRDHFWHHAERLLRVNVTKRAAEELLFNAEGHDPAISPDGTKILFAREGEPWWRKGYRGSQASQIWLYDLSAGEFTKLVDHDRGCRTPLWQPDGKGFYYVGGQSGSYNLWQRDLATGQERQLTEFRDDSVLMPCISRDGSTIVFRHLFDFYRYRPTDGKAPEKVQLLCDSDVAPEPLVHRILQTASEVSFAADGLEVAMIGGGDLWVMDTELREPRQVTDTPEEERCPAFAPDGKSLLFVRDEQGRSDIWRATRAEAEKYWWQIIRDYYYDEALGNRNWDEIRRKYAPMARLATDTQQLGEVVCLMLGELNGSHLNFYPGSEEPPAADSEQVSSRASSGDHSWKETTAHLGVRFDAAYQGPGCKVKDVIPGSPADKVKTKILAGEIVLSIDGRAIDPALDLTLVLNGPPQREIELRVRNAQGTDRQVSLRPIGYEKARSLLYEAWIHETQEKVTDRSDGKLGYLHIRSMNMPSFYQFERDLYAEGVGKEGLIIDVRENRGGSTTDHLLTALTQPVHAITVPRGGQPGYPQDRKVYATWNKPIVVLCNQNSFSNAEIFTHAIQTLRRGLVVGVPTAGGVISTRNVEIMDVGRLRVPHRGWFLLDDGEDMELHAAVPDYVVWPKPGDLCIGKDEQLDKAIEVLQAEVEKWSRRPQPKLRKASQRGQ